MSMLFHHDTRSADTLNGTYHPKRISALRERTSGFCAAACRTPYRLPAVKDSYDVRRDSADGRDSGGGPVTALALARGVGGSARFFAALEFESKKLEETRGQGPCQYRGGGRPAPKHRSWYWGSITRKKTQDKRSSEDDRRIKNACHNIS